MFQVKFRCTVGNTRKHVERAAETCGKTNRGEALSVFVDETFLFGCAEADKQNLCAALVDPVDDVVGFFFTEKAVAAIDFNRRIFFS